MKRNINKFAVIGGFIAMIALCFVLINGNQNNTVYVESETSTAEPATVPKKEFDFNLYMDDQTQFCINVIKDWQQVNSANGVEFIHSPTASSLSVMVSDYAPAVNNVSKDSAIIPQGGQMQVFEKYSHNEYFFNYLISTNGGMYNVINYTVWDKKHIIEFVFKINNEYPALLDRVTYMIDSIFFVPEDPIPESFYVAYDGAANFSFAYKDSWEALNTEDGYSLYDSQSGMMINIERIKSTETLENITQMDYTNFAGRTRQQFCLTAYQNDGKHIQGEATYTSGQKQIYMIQHIFCTGEYEVILSIDIPAAAYEAVTGDLNVFMEEFIFW